MKKPLVFLLITMLTCTAGCALVTPKQPSVIHAPAEKTDATFRIPVSHVETRIRFLENFIKTEDLSHSDKKAALALLDAYRLLKKTAHGPVTGKACKALTHSLYESMSLMEKTYFETLAATSEDENSFALFIRKRNEILDLYLDGNYKGVIHRCLALKTNFGSEGLTPEIGLVFALSLGRDGMLEEAVEIGSRVAKELEQTPDVVQLRVEIARWQMALGQEALAAKTFFKISDTQDDRASMVNNLRNRIKHEPREPDQPTHVSVFQPAEAAAGQDAPPHMGPLQEKVDALVQNHEFAEARRLLLNDKAEREEGPETELIDRALKNVEETEGAYDEKVRIKDAYLKQTYEAAIRLYEKEDYKGVINKLREMERTQTPDAASTDLKSRAIENLINLERNRAAEIFLAAKKTKDPEKKRELLEASYKILRTLVEDYPHSPLKHKLTSHINIVQGEIEKLPLKPPR